MAIRRHLATVALILFALSLAPAGVLGQSGGSLKGTVTLGIDNTPVHDARVTILQLRRSTATGDDGAYSFDDVPPGRYDVVAHLDRIQDVAQNVEVAAGTSATADFVLQISTLSESVTVTATGREELTSNSIQSVDVIGSQELARKNPISLGEALDNQPGIAKRSSGPATARPVIRGFDGDRVLVLQDGNRVGGLGFQSGDHAEPVDVLSVERIEVVRGPATLLYGSSAIGGVVNAVTEHGEAIPGLRGYLTTVGSTNNYQASGNAGVEYGTEHFVFWANGGAQRVGDYDTPLGRVTNSWARGSSFTTGFGYYPGKGFFSVAYTFDDKRYGIPFQRIANLGEPASGAGGEEPEEAPEIVFLTPRRKSIQLNGGFRGVDAFVEDARFSFQYNDYKHEENEALTGEVGTRFKNDSFVYKGIFDQRRRGRLSGQFGFWGLRRDYESVGEEALAPPTTQDAFAGYGLETLTFSRLVLQFGGRVERNGYDTDELPGDELGRRDRSFTGFSGAVGVRVPTWEGGSVVANYSHSYRAPALEELYNFGPHPGNRAFEVGDPELDREVGEGIDFGVRHTTDRFRAEANGYYYKMRDFVFLAPTGEVEDGLVVADYLQADSRYTGFEAQASARLHPNVWLHTDLSYVSAETANANTPLPRIPPLRGRVGLEFLYRNFRVSPEVVFSDRQDRIFATETETPGYGVFDLNASYTLARDHAAHVVSLNAFNLGDRLYFNHLSFIKDFAPEIGRGVRLAYTVRFF